MKMYDVRISKMKRIKLHIIRLFVLLLMLVSGAANHAWATNVTYHILTLPIDSVNRYNYHMKPFVHGWRLEAFKVVVNNQGKLELPAQYKSPLVTSGSFKYYKASDVNKYSSGTALNLFDVGSIKGVLYRINGEETETTEDDPTPVTEGTTLSGTTDEYYVVYTYNASNTIAKLDGNVRYNIRTKYRSNDKDTWKDKGFFALNRGRNNRPAVLPTANVDPEMLSSEDFMVASVDGTKVSPYWKDGNNKNNEAVTGSKFHFMFKFEGNDPYNIIIRTAYAKDTTYIEKNDGTNNFVYKWYKEASLFGVSAGNNYYIASDEHRLYKTAYNSANPNPINPDYDTRHGNYHGQSGVVWNTVALLPNSDNSGYVFMGTRTVDANGAINNTLYYLKEKDNCNNLTLNSGNSSNNLSIEGLYPIEKVTFKVVTPFGHTVSVGDQVSKYTVDNDPIETKYLPAALKRKYCNFNGKFYSDAACAVEIKNFSEATKHATEGYQVYVGYDVKNAPFTAIKPADSYTTATWYELTDESSVQESGRKIKNNSGTYKNNGANGDFVKESEFAFIGDPYELKVLYRKGTESTRSNTYVTLSTNDSWEIPNDATDGSFLLRKFNGPGYWSWDAGQTSVDVAYGSPSTPSVDKNAHTVTINLSGLNTSKYYKITTGGAGVSQIVSVSPSANTVRKVPGATMSIVVNLAENTSGEDQEMTVTIQEYNDGEGNTISGSASVVTITQSTASSEFAGNEVTYSTSSSTRVKVLTLPTRTYTYKIVDKSGRIAVKASVNQPIYSKLSLASIPSIIVSPFLVGERVKFYNSYENRNGDGKLSRLDFHYDTGGASEQDTIPETPNVDHDIFVTYETEHLNDKPINLSEDQEFNVVLNGEYIYYDSSNGGSIKSNKTPTSSEKTSGAYLWKLRNKDPYHMLIDNMGARTAMSVSGDEDVTVYNDDGSTVTPTPKRQKGAWVKLKASLDNDVALEFTTTRTEAGGAQQFIAKSGLQGGVYEVMVAAGDDGTDATDASKNYYNIGRTSATDIKIYKNTTYAHGNSVLMFQLEQTIDYVYHLIDKNDHVLLSQTSQSPDLVLPAEYQSPLVGTYHYYDPRFIHIDGDTYTLTEDPTPTELTQMSDLDATFTKTSGDYSSQWNASDAKLTATSEDDVVAKAKKLTSTGHFYYKVGESDYYDVNVSKICYTDIYVTYDINDRVKFNDKASPYMLKFWNGLSYQMEDGNDGLTSGTIKAMYPYTNGDGSLNIYGDDMQKEQFNGGSSTRPRWIWFFESEKKDPYHVMIHSSSTIKYNDVSHSTYLQTFAVDFVQGATTPKHIVTCGMLPTIASEAPTEYMVLGTDGQFRLRTTNTIYDGTSTIRRDVTSLEQYWKTYNMAKLHVLGVNKNTDAYSTDESTWVVPTADDPSTLGVDEGTYRATLAARDWHSYAIYANATRWNGYNDKTDGHEKKVVEKIEHWFQTFDMGDGAFDIESASIPPVLVLLDLHGWEIMRQPLPDISTYPEGKALDALRAYDSPMVDKYYFYSNATKASGCHKYSLRLDDNKKERDQIKRPNGEHYASESLGDLPDIDYTGVKSNGVLNDQYVIYTVKEEYAKSYSYTFTDNGDNTYTESGTASKFLILLGSRFFRDLGSNTSYFSKPIYEASNPVGGNAYEMILSPQTTTTSGVSTQVDSDGDGKIDNINLWYVQPNLNIDKEMGIKYATEAGGTGEPWTEFETKKYYYEKGKSGFDPYNIQLKNAENGKFVTSHQTTATLDDGILIGDYTGTGGTTDMTLEAEYSYAGWDPNTDTKSEGYDHTNLTISNQTFMAVSDANDNLQLMPRFDHTKRVNLVNNAADSFTTLQDPVDHDKASASDNTSMGTQTAFFVRSQIFEYQIINNSGNESLRYKRGGDYYPTITDHFKSPLAKDFTYYKGAEYNVENSTSSDFSSAGASFQRTATSEEEMKAQAGLFATKDATYYFNINSGASYKKVTVTKAYPGDEITGSFADAGLNGDDCHVYVRYSYDANADHDGDGILEGKWFTIKLANKDVVASGTIDFFQRTVADDAAYTTAVAALSVDGVYYFKKLESSSNKPYMKVTVSNSGGTKSEVESDATEWANALDGTGVSLLQASTSKPDPVDADDKVWQWKFLVAPMDPESEYYIAPDPYDIQVFNRSANYTTDLTLDPNPMSVGIKVNGADHFALLSHTSGYALAVAGTGAYTYDFVNGNSMTTSVAATTATESSFTQKTGIFDGVKSQLLVSDDVEHTFTYKVINNGDGTYAIDNPGYLAVEATQNDATASSNGYVPYLPESAQTPLLNAKKDEEKEEDYLYYGSATLSEGKYTVVPLTKLFTLYGLYDDVVYVRYKEYDMDKTPFKVPNKRNATSETTVARADDSQDASMNINGGLPYNIIWYNDDMMKANGASISKDENQDLTGNTAYVWLFVGNDPYNLKIKHKDSNKYIYNSDGASCSLHDSKSTSFMLLSKSGYDCGVLAKTGAKRYVLSGNGNSLADTEAAIPEVPNHYIIFGLSVHDLIYRLIIARTYSDSEKASPTADQYVEIPCQGEPGNTKKIYGTTQRNLSTTYQLGGTINVDTTPYDYCVDAGAISIGDLLQVPNEFNRPNCTYEFYIDGVWNDYNSSTKTISNANSDLNELYKGLKLDEVSPRLMSDANLINKVVRVNIVYKFNENLATNSGLDFVKSTGQNLWYTFETKNGSTPYLAQYTNAWGMQSMEGRETRYTNDYLWTPLGDVYGFKMYNRYMIKNSGANDKVMTFAGDAGPGKRLVVAKPGAKVTPEGSEIYTEGNEIFELLSGDDPNSGYFRVQSVANQGYYVIRNTSADNYTELSTTPCDWTFGLDMSLLEPYYDRAGYVGGLTTTVKAGTSKTKSGKTLYEETLAEKPFKIIDLQAVVYDDDNIVDFAPGYYRLHSVPGTPGIDPVRYASGYLHETEKTAVSGGIPMHFYSKAGVSGTFDGDINPLASDATKGYTESPATRGDIPVPATEYDPSTIFYLYGGKNPSDPADGVNPRVTMSTQGLYVKGNAATTDTGDAVMTTTAGEATTFSLIDIGGAVLLITNKLDPDTRDYLHYGQSENKYDLKYYHNSPTNEARWCIAPADSLMVTTNNGGDGYYYSTFCAPYDVLLPENDGTKTYYAYICDKWNNTNLHPQKVPEVTGTTSYDEGKFVPAGTPVILRVKDESGSMKLTLPNNAPTTISDPTNPLTKNIFSGKYLEQMLPLDAGDQWLHDVYTLGLPFISDVHKDDSDYSTTGDITAPKPEQASSGLGFYINATANKENNASKARWDKNNRYVIHNKIYYRAGATPGASAPQLKGPEFVPVIFDDLEEQDEELNPNGAREIVGDGCVYDLMGRKVATREQVEDGSWKQRVATGIYILNGKKFQKK